MQRLDPDMNVAYLILAHKDPAQLRYLTETLLEAGDMVFIHIDAKSKSYFHSFLSEFGTHRQVKVYSWYNVRWGGFNQIRATLRLMQEALNYASFDYVQLLSGQDMPVKPITEFKRYLAMHRGKSFLSYNRLPDMNGWAGNGGLDRIQLLWLVQHPSSLDFLFNKINVCIHITQRALGHFRNRDIVWYGGTNWCTLTHEAVMFILKYLKDNSRFLKRFRFTRCADELILQTMLLNSPLANHVINKTLTFALWDTGQSSPRVLRVSDAESIKESGSFFARKFESASASAIINTLIT